VEYPLYAMLVKYFEIDAVPSYASKIQEVLGCSTGYCEEGLQDIIPVHVLLRRAILVDDLAVMIPSKVRS
jgi:hypothetical protein